VAEVAFVGLLLVATTLFVSSFVHLTRADLGFDRRNLIEVSQARVTGTLADVLGVLESTPGVAAVGALSRGSTPLVMAGFGGGASGTEVRRVGSDMTPVAVLYLRVSGGYFETAGIAMLQGRAFFDSEVGRRDLVVLDERAARALFGEESPLGAQVFVLDEQPVTVVGIVEHVRFRGPEEDVGPQLYTPTDPRASGHQFLVRSEGPPAAAIPALRAALDGLRPVDSPPVTLRLIEDAFRNVTAQRRFVSRLMSLFGILTVLIGAAGGYGVMMSVVTQRTREVGIRMALGASPAAVLAATVRLAARQLVLGLMIGLPAGYFATRGFANLLYEVTPADASVYAIVATLVLVVGVIAALVPARRAARVDPLVTLKSE
jgi:ABC-type antimicrobial peptide transport system permease subunit